ncbi:ABC transporter ATP-binding protein [Shewanella sp. WXL01]|uniref:ABC transporter ATP-binding protein n=1 Tax=Shewanella sp. WXL01 TaxID=2709721 RepID=UPI0014386CFB|nr:ABC transporter ATP-binding protein [Shewanella sp. WXL01]NKF50536.1 ABC transporter ATP-binding protein [Shewanella sp. WXL01]
MKLIECNNLSKKYGDKLALNSVSLTLDSGEPIALVGPNGAGKTTLFSLLCGYILPSSGEVSILGHKPGSASLHNQVSALPQDAALDPNFTVETQLAFFARLQGMSSKQAKQEVKRVLELVDMAQSAKLKPLSLSHGMTKRVAIAQALIGSPKLVLLDEPTAGLDPANARKVREIVKQQSANTTFMISSHNLEELEKLCDKVLYLENGQLQQSVSIHSTQSSEYLTVTLTNNLEPELIESITRIDSVIEVKQTSEQQLVIEYSKSSPFYIERTLLELFESNRLQYKSMLAGRTLEDTLFAK